MRVSLMCELCTALCTARVQSVETSFLFLGTIKNESESEQPIRVRINVQSHKLIKNHDLFQLTKQYEQNNMWTDAQNYACHLRYII